MHRIVYAYAANFIIGTGHIKIPQMLPRMIDLPSLNADASFLYMQETCSFNPFSLYDIEKPSPSSLARVLI